MKVLRYVGGDVYNGPTYTAYPGQTLELDDSEADRVLAAFPKLFLVAGAVEKQTKAPITKPMKGMTK